MQCVAEGMMNARSKKPCTPSPHENENKINLSQYSPARNKIELQKNLEKDEPAFKILSSQEPNIGHKFNTVVKTPVVEKKPYGDIIEIISQFGYDVSSEQVRSVPRSHDKNMRDNEKVNPNDGSDNEQDVVPSPTPSLVSSLHSSQKKPKKRSYSEILESSSLTQKNLFGVKKMKSPTVIENKEEQSKGLVLPEMSSKYSINPLFADFFASPSQSTLDSAKPETRDSLHQPQSFEMGVDNTANGKRSAFFVGNSNSNKVQKMPTLQERMELRVQQAKQKNITKTPSQKTNNHGNDKKNQIQNYLF
ncbi:hypothetical protein RFI_14140 [Reticulomyxa filosa]|uniref:Uncharacterized protein n=1 Tax=Reticulomyxa filosa TaxID=46433 RepID=X6NAV3_RETFI|nr:hypothetical protein RFI_14140 [Reticulomyxa filosa]|eukprot:ETO23043.1 hypothetical protein RFI_14140 [Reticulomyxa filosa]